MSNKDFYRAFEERHRGSRELIKKRLSVYLPFVLPLKKLYPDDVALDIGCGRGEWLELLKNNQIPAKGMDLDVGMLKACHLLNLDVTKGDGIKSLKKQDDESLIIISAFHVVEHISFEELQSLVEQSLRVLKPGGLLILETPNPENIKVATENFYLDPTHIKPIPANLLSFLPEFYGFFRTKVLKLQESSELIKQDNINLLQVIEGVSPDYAVVAQKKADKEVLEKFDTIFAKDFGLSLNSLTQKFENRLLQMEEKATKAQIKARESDAKAQEAQSKAQEAEAKILDAEAKTQEALYHYHSVINSNSWKVTKPLRLAGKFARWFKTGAYHWITFSPTSRPRRVTKKTLILLKEYINTKPRLKAILLNILNNFPKLKTKLKNINSTNFTKQNTTTTNLKLSPKAKKVYEDLIKEIDLQKGNKS